MKYIIILLVLLTVNVKANTYEEVTLDKCIDGDTASFYKGKEKLTFRFLGIDTPESVHPKKKPEPFGKEASDYTCNELKKAKKILIQYDDKSDKTDKYGRHLAWIWVDDELLQKKIITNGYGKVAYVYNNYSYIDRLCANQKIAMKNKLNVWQNKDYTEDYCKKVNTTNVSLEIKREEGKVIDQKKIIFLIGALLLIIISLITHKKINKNKMKKLLKQGGVKL